MRLALYARFSTDQQRDASIDDQLRICREHAARQGWTDVVGHYEDRAASGASLVRAGIQRLLSDARAKKFDAVLAESLDRFSRDQERIAHLYNRLTRDGVQMVTISDGVIGRLHIGLKGTMNALYLDDLRDKRGAVFAAVSKPGSPAVGCATATASCGCSMGNHAARARSIRSKPRPCNGSTAHSWPACPRRPLRSR